MMKNAKRKTQNAKFKDGLAQHRTCSGAGFTVLETIIAVLVVSLAIAGATLATRSGIMGGSIAKEDVKAFFLAQEVVEFLANKRDSNELSALQGGGNHWLTGIADIATDPCFPGNTCELNGRVGVDPAFILERCTGACRTLRQHQTLYIHGYDAGWTATQFKREIQIEKPSANEVVVTIRISWNHGSVAKEFKTKAILTNWFQSAEPDL